MDKKNITWSVLQSCLVPHSWADSSEPSGQSVSPSQSLGKIKNNQCQLQNRLCWPSGVGPCVIYGTP